MDLPVPPVDALAHPTRARLFTLLGELRRPGRVYVADEQPWNRR